MTDVVRGDGPRHLRQPLPSDSPSLKSFRYEDAADGRPPVLVASINPPGSRPPLPATSKFPPPPIPNSQSGSKQTRINLQRPRTSPSPRSHTPPHLAEDVKRDSAFAPSPPGAGSDRSSAKKTGNPADLSSTHRTSGASRLLPTILVQDHNDPSTAPRRPFSPPSSERRGRADRPQQRRTKARSSSPPLGIQRIRSFKGIQSPIPSGGFGEDFTFEDLATDKVEFSNRGSLLFGGRKMNLLFQEARGHGQEIPRESMSTNGDDGYRPPKEEVKRVDVGGISNMSVTECGSEAQGDKVEAVQSESGNDARTGSAGAQDQKLDESAGDAAVRNEQVGQNTASRQDAPTKTDDSMPRPGLVSGRRKPSVQMLQAALQGGRVLSAEEITFSMKVRSMYEHGDERAAEWGSPSEDAIASELAATLARDDRTISSIDTVLNERDVSRPHSEHAVPTAQTQTARSMYSRRSNELAGGIEDWDEVKGQDVDRYGFINPRRISSRDSAASAGTIHGVQRVATTLRLEAEQPRRDRKLRRSASFISRSSKSVPPRSDGDNATMTSVNTVRSTHGHSSNPFRSRERRVVESASDMLHLPPGLSDIAEQENGGMTATMLKRREWSREEKWRKMARHLPDDIGNTGGGQRFDFDTSDPKLIARTWKGIPDRWRATAWHSFLTTSARKRAKGATDDTLIARFHQLQTQSSADDVQIDVDVPRTISMHIMFRRRYRGGQRLLFRVLHAISLHCPDTGYVQGMASLGATLLCYYDEERAFVMLVRLWELRGLDQLFQSGFEGLMRALDSFERHWLGPGPLVGHLRELGVQPTAYGTRWYLTLFNMSVPFPAQLRIWDVFMLLGDAPVGALGPPSSTLVSSPGRSLSTPTPTTTTTALRPDSSTETNAAASSTPTDAPAPAPAAADPFFAGADLSPLHAASAALVDATREILLDGDFENAMKVLTSFIPVRDEDLMMKVALAEWRLKAGGGKR